MSFFLQISLDLLQNETIKSLKGDHYKIFISFLQLLNFNDQIKDDHGTKIKVQRGQILSTYREMAEKFGTKRTNLERLFKKLEKEGIISKKPGQRKTVFYLEERYMVEQKTGTNIEKTGTRSSDSVEPILCVPEKQTGTQLYTLPNTSSLSSIDKVAIARARRLGDCSQLPKKLPPLSQGQSEEKQEFARWSSSYGHNFSDKSIIYWLKTYGFLELCKVFNDMISRKTLPRDPPAWITSSLKKGWIPEKQRIVENKAWLENYVKENIINYIEITKKHCNFIHVCYNDTIKYEIIEFKRIIEEKVKNLEETRECVKNG